MKQSLITFRTTILFLICGLIALIGCEIVHDTLTISTSSKQAIAIINPTSDSTVTGMAVFTQSGNSIELSIEVKNSSPGVHTVHIHENGDCSSPDGKSAGGHWNPTEVAHGKWGEGEFHLGDIGNITVGDDGSGTIELSTELWEIGTGSILDVVGKGIIVHAGADDFMSQPSGNAGARIGCGVIELAE